MIRFTTLTYVLLWISSTPDTWISIGPSAYVASGGKYVAEVFTPTYRLNFKGQRALCYVYSVAARKDRSYKFTLMWRDSLLSYMPEAFFLTSDAYLITVDREDPGAPHTPALAIYHPTGRIVKSFPFDSLGERYTRSLRRISGMWNFGARFFYFEIDHLFYALLESGYVMEFRVTDGRYRLGRLDGFPNLKDAAAKKNGFAELGFGKYHLYFSSITELEAARRGKLK